jgi:hypothetical protein
MVQKLPSACTPDITPPTFAGIATAVPQANGSIIAGWLAATDLGAGVAGYKVFIHKASNPALDLWLSTNLALITNELSIGIYGLRGNVALEAGVSYRIGVRAFDNEGNVDSNLISLLATSTGVLTSSLATIAAQLAAASLSVAASADAIGGGIDIEADVDPEVDVEADADPEINLETDC